MFENIVLLIAIASILSFAFFVQRLTGFGSAIIATPVLSLFWSPHNAINLLTIFQAAFGILLIKATWHQLKEKNLLLFMIPFVIMNVVGVVVLPELPEMAVRWSIGVVVIIVLFQWLFAPEFKIRGRIVMPLALIFGFLSGAIQGAFGTGGPFFLAYYGSVAKKSSEIRDGSIAAFFVANLLRLPVAASTAQINGEVLLAAACAAIPFVIVMYLGGKITQKLDETKFRFLMICILVISALNLFFKS